MSARLSPLDNHAYLERRAARADAAQANCDAAVAQAMRRHVAIDNAALRLRAVIGLNSERAFNREAVNELLEEIASDLQRANQVREGDRQ